MKAHATTIDNTRYKIELALWILGSLIAAAYAYAF